MAIDPRLQQPGPIRTANEELLDALIRHQIGVMRFAGSTRDKILLLLDATEADLRAEIKNRLRTVVGLDTPGSVHRMNRLLQEIESIRGTAWGEVDDTLRREMTALAQAEPRMLDGFVKTVLPVNVTTVLPAADRLRAIVTAKPFEGKVLKDHVAKLRRDDIARIQDQIRIGLTQGQNVQQIARRVTGTVALKGANGVTQITRKHAALIVRTAANHVANEAGTEYALANSDFIDLELYVATLDSKTTPICRALDGDRYPVAEGPHPPLHIACRSRRVPLLDPEPLGERPVKPVTRQQMLREFSKQEGFDAPRNRAGLPRGTKGAFDEFERRRTRELIGRVPAKTTYQQFLSRQSAAFQNDVLGKTKGALFRNGGLTLDKFVDRTTGKEFTLDELARSHASAFRAAGLDPRDYFD